MRMSAKRFSLLALATVALLVGAIVYVRASERFGDCNSVEYLRMFDARLAEGLGALGRDDFQCVVALEVPVDTPSGEKRIRVIRHVASDWAEGPGVSASVASGVHGSAAALPRLGDFRIGNATVLLLDDFGPGSRHENFGEIAAWTRIGPNGECLITLWLLGRAARADRAGPVIAHELMHCVQFASLTAGQMGSATPGGASGGGTWWMEGSADWFGTVALPAAPFIAGRVNRFDIDSPRVALNLMTYDAFVFFAWLGGAQGPDAVLPFLHGMAESSHASAQQAAMREVLPADGWLQFAKDYLDQRIRDGHGASIGSAPADGDDWTFTETRSERIALDPFVLRRGYVVFECGRWSVRATPAEHHAVEPARGDWGAFPATVDALDGEPRRFRFAAMPAAERRVDITLRATKDVACEECAGTREIDQCLVGTWRMTNDGMAEFANRMMRGFARVAAVEPNTTMVLSEDRSFTNTTTDAQNAIVAPDKRGFAQMSGNTSGRWSASGGVLNACPDAHATAGTVTGSGAGISKTAPMPGSTARPMRNAYVCDGETLRIELELGRAGTLRNTFRRVSPPPGASPAR